MDLICNGILCDDINDFQGNLNIEQFMDIANAYIYLDDGLCALMLDYLILIDVIRSSKFLGLISIS